jgi:phospholipid/cholesterol/gamma-HCH transport system substrate-binding protein
MKLEVKVGIFVIISLIILLISAMYIENIQLAGKEYDFHILFEFASDIKIRGKVKIGGGLVVGRIKNITYDEETGFTKVTVGIKQGIKIRKDAEFAIFTSGMMGEKYIEISGGTKTAGYIKEGDVVKGISPQSMDMALGRITKVSEDFREALNSLTNILSNPETIQNISDSLKRINMSISELENIVKVSKPKVVSTLSTLELSAKELNKAAASIHSFTEELREITSKKNVKNVEDIISTLSQVSKKIDKTATELESIVKRIESGEGTVGVLLNDKKVAEDIKSLISDIRKNPWKLFIPQK